MRQKHVAPLLLVTLATAMMPANQTNFFEWTSGVHEGSGWGRICYEMSLYVPTCGWQLILTSSYALTGVSVWDSYAVGQNSFTFILSNRAYNQDFSGGAPSCGAVTLYGHFWNTMPEIVVNYYCVCTDINSGCESVPYQTVPTGAASTFGISSTFPSTVPTTQVTTWYPGQTIADPTQIYLKIVNGTCYLGTSKTTLTQIDKLAICCSRCILDSTCFGVNFKQGQKQCDLVHEDLHQSLWTLWGPDTNCEFWDVQWKR